MDRLKIFNPDWRRKTFSWQLGILALGNVADFVTTTAFIASDGLSAEGNPLIRHVIGEYGLLGFAAVKCVTTAVQAFLLNRFYKKYLDNPNKDRKEAAALIALTGYNALLTLVSLSNLYVFFDK